MPTRIAGVKFRNILLVLSNIVIAIACTGCITAPMRVEPPANLVSTAHIMGFGAIRLDADAKESRWLTWRDEMRLARKVANDDSAISVLAISSGADKGAFSAGFIKGWTKTGHRPEFDIVTGVSTGALIAPFAFLGAEYDQTIENFYTNVTAKGIYHVNLLRAARGAPSLADTTPLKNLIAKNIDQDLVKRIAAEHSKGRRLLVMSTNLDAERGVVWDIGALASTDNPDRLDLIRKILLASASIPGVFPPVMIDVDIEGSRYTEMHVDGSAVSSIFAIPYLLLWSQGDTQLAENAGSLTVLYNNHLEPQYEETDSTIFSIFNRALSASITTADRQKFADYSKFAKDNNFPFEVFAMEEDFSLKSKGFFNPAYMKALYDYGHGKALQELSSKPAVR